MCLMNPDLIETATQRALAAGALVPLQMVGETVDDGGVSFRVEWLSSLAMKDVARLPRVGDKAKAGANPFLPFEQALYIADLTPTHIAILNKFPGQNGHFLVITREFVEQSSPLQQHDFEAAALALRSTGGLFFYNSGDASGASQRHRHMQIMPGFVAPLEAILPRTGFESPAPAPLPFRNLFRRWDLATADDAAALMAETVHAAYETFGLLRDDGLAAPYNLAMTRDWFFAAPRLAEHSHGLSISGLSVVGLIGLRTQDQIELVRSTGPMQMLVDVIGAR